MVDDDGNENSKKCYKYHHRALVTPSARRLRLKDWAWHLDHDGGG